MNDGETDTPVRSQRGGFRRIAAALALFLGLSVSGVAIAGPATAAPVASAKKATVHHALKAATPTITGTVRVGSTLTANPGSWGPAPVKVKYQWKVAGKAVARATAKSWKLPTTAAGKKVTVTVSVSKSGYGSASKTSRATSAVAKAVLVGTTPRISGTPKVHATLTANIGTWTSGTTIRYAWKRNGSVITNAASQNYVVATADQSTSLTVTVTGSKTGYLTKSLTSAAVSIPALVATPPAPLTLTSSTPTITGNPRSRETLTANTGTWTSGTRFQYVWKRNGSAIPGATGQSYVPGLGDQGTSITVTVTGSKSGYTSKTLTSGAVSISAPSQLLNGEQLTVNQSLRSPNGAYVLVMQSDGNLVEYGPSGAVWASGTGGADHVVMQSDGNLVVYSPSAAKWGSGTDGYGAGVTLSLQDDSNLVLYRIGSAVWTRAVVRWLVVGANAKSGSTPGTQSMSGPTLASTQYGIYPPGAKVPVVCGTQSGQGVAGAFTSAKDTTWHRLLGGDWVPDSDFYTGTNGLFAGEPDCTPAGGGNGASKLDSYVAAHPAGGQVGDGQCVALVKDYLRTVWGENPGALGNAIDYRSGGTGGNFLTANGWTWSTNQSFSPGDILVWGAGSYTSSYGHVAIWFNENGHQMYEQNGTGANALRVFYGNFFASGYLGHWHHN